MKDMKPFDPFDILGVEHAATDREIRKAYYKLSKEYHPDKVSAWGVSIVLVSSAGADSLAAAVMISFEQWEVWVGKVLQQDQWEWEEGMAAVGQGTGKKQHFRQQQGLGTLACKPHM
jgi:hypothetical protein